MTSEELKAFKGTTRKARKSSKGRAGKRMRGTIPCLQVPASPSPQPSPEQSPTAATPTVQPIRIRLSRPVVTEGTTSTLAPQAATTTEPITTAAELPTTIGAEAFSFPIPHLEPGQAEPLDQTFDFEMPDAFSNEFQFSEGQMFSQEFERPSYPTTPRDQPQGQVVSSSDDERTATDDDEGDDEASQGTHESQEQEQTDGQGQQTDTHGDTSTYEDETYEAAAYTLAIKKLYRTMEKVWARKKLTEEESQKIIEEELVTGGFEDAYIKGFKELVQSVGSNEALRYLQRKPLPQFDPRRVRLLSKPGEYIRVPTGAQSSEQAREACLVPERSLAEETIIVDSPPRATTVPTSVVTEVPTTPTAPLSPPVHPASPLHPPSPRHTSSFAGGVAETVFTTTHPTIPAPISPNLPFPTPTFLSNPFLHQSFPSFPTTPRPLFPFPPPLTFSPVSPPQPTVTPLSPFHQAATGSPPVNYPATFVNPVFTPARVPTITPIFTVTALDTSTDMDISPPTAPSLTSLTAQTFLGTSQFSTITTSSTFPSPFPVPVASTPTASSFSTPLILSPTVDNAFRQMLMCMTQNYARLITNWN
ncbi:hypothetical protein KP509_1Z224300 [Ceratopteris richardii]|nr:hypothetical protein KP509_1Z224300 [Ceratopteris richardii]